MTKFYNIYIHKSNRIVFNAAYLPKVNFTQSELNPISL